MDGSRFDTATRSLADVRSRRRAVRLLAGLLLGGPLAFGSERGDAHNALKKCKKLKDKAKRKKCVKKAKAHNDQHTAQTAPPFPCTGQANGTPCGPGPSNLCCNGVCVDTATDEAHCGACNQPCPANLPTCCAGSCVDPASDETNCGGCGTTCLSDEICDGANGCCEEVFSECVDYDDRCCGESFCSGGIDGRCCGLTGVSNCVNFGCSYNAYCPYCCQEFCGNDAKCASCIQSGGSCQGFCGAGQACAWCCSGRCGPNGTCCEVTGATCSTGSECCSDTCAIPPDRKFGTCT